MAKRSKGVADTPRAGSCWAVPLPRLGQCVVVVARGPNPVTGFTFVYLWSKVHAVAPPAAAIPPLATWGEAWIGLAPTRPFTTGRWIPLGDLPKFDPEAWPVPPLASIERLHEKDADRPLLCSIETYPDEATMSVLASERATPERAAGFPEWDVATQASALEKSLVHHFKNRTPSYLDMKIHINRVDGDAIVRWNAHSRRVRDRGGLPSHLLPPGAATDRALKAGDWLAFPMANGGFGAAIVVMRTPESMRVFSDVTIMSMRRRWDRWPTMQDVRGLGARDGAMLGQTSMICVRDGRWRVIGSHERFVEEEWPWPLPWHRTRTDMEEGTITLTLRRDKPLTMRIDPKVLALDEKAGELMRMGHGYGNFEAATARVIEGHPWLGAAWAPDWRVTPARLEAWKRINEEVIKMLATLA